jgi:hypothetical protein
MACKAKRSSVLSIKLGWLGQGFGQRVKAGLAGGQALGIAHELKTFVDRIAQHIGQIVQVQRGQVPGAVGLAQGAKGPTDRVARAIVLISVERRKAGAFGQKAPACDAVAERAVSALQKRDHRVDADGVIVEVVEEEIHRTRALFDRQSQRHITQIGQPLFVQQGQYRGQGQVFLCRIETPCTQKTRQVGRGRVGRVELRHRRDEAQDFERGGAGHQAVGFRKGGVDYQRAQACPSAFMGVLTFRDWLSGR